MSLTKVMLKRFTAFDDLELELSPGINVLVGANGTGKTHLMKVCYAACDVSKTSKSFAEKLTEVFLPSGNRPGRLVKRQRGRQTGTVEVYQRHAKISATFASHQETARAVRSTGEKLWNTTRLESVYIPVKEMLSNAPGFRSLYARREIHFEAVYADILDRAYLPVIRGPIDSPRKRLLSRLQKAIDGRVHISREEFFLRNRQGNLEFTLLAEGMRKLGLLWLLIQNGTLQNGSVLFWDEPETNLNPRLYGDVMDVLLELQRNGVQIIFATHDYVILKELDLRMRRGDKVAFHSLYRTQEGEIECDSVSRYLEISPNVIEETFTSLYDREIERSVGDFGR